MGVRVRDAAPAAWQRHSVAAVATAKVAILLFLHVYLEALRPCSPPFSPLAPETRGHAHAAMRPQTRGAHGRSISPSTWGTRFPPHAQPPSPPQEWGYGDSGHRRLTTVPSGQCCRPGGGGPLCPERKASGPPPPQGPNPRKSRNPTMSGCVANFPRNPTRNWMKPPMPLEGCAQESLQKALTPRPVWVADR